MNEGRRQPIENGGRGDREAVVKGRPNYALRQFSGVLSAKSRRKKTKQTVAYRDTKLVVSVIKRTVEERG